MPKPPLLPPYFSSSGIRNAFLPVIALSFCISIYAFYGQQPEAPVEYSLSPDPLPADSSQSSKFDIDGKFRGVNLGGWRGMDSLDWQQLLHNKVEWVALTPQAWQQTVDSDSLVYNRRDRRGFDRTKMLAQLVQDAQSKGMRVLMKPHVWINRTVGNEWRSTMLPKGERWQKWSASYRDFIMEFARLSDSLGVDALCIGTELDAIAKAYPAYWTDLIQSIRKVYKGSLTYGANWDAFEDIQFWGQLDYIGVQAYFPLTKKQEPPVASLCAAWQSHYRKIRKLHQRYGKPVVFTEVGYRSVADAAHEPWTWTGETDHLTKRASPGTQSNCYEALFQVFWDQKWFAGALFWEWEGRFRNRDNDQVDFTPQGKPAEQVMARWFGKVSL